MVDVRLCKDKDCRTTMGERAGVLMLTVSGVKAIIFERKVEILQEAITIGLLRQT